MTSYHSTIAGLERDIADLMKRDASEASKEADLMSKQHRAMEDAGKTKSSSTLSSKLRDAERAAKDLASVRKNRADLATRIASKNKDLRSYSERQLKQDQADQKKASDAQKKMADEQRRIIKEREEHDRRVRASLSASAAAFPTMMPSSATAITASAAPNYDFFISHASEDKDSFVRALAQALTDLGADIFYDEATLRVGDSLRRKIDEGLARSRFGVVVLSEAFFRKEWPARELDGLVARETSGASRILPIWHKVSKDEVSNYSPTLADKVALNTATKSVAEIATELYKMLGT